MVLSGSRTFAHLVELAVMYGLARLAGIQPRSARHDRCRYMHANCRHTASSCISTGFYPVQLDAGKTERAWRQPQPNSLQRHPLQYLTHSTFHFQVTRSRAPHVGLGPSRQPGELRLLVLCLLCASLPSRYMLMPLIVGPDDNHRALNLLLPLLLTSKSC
ncbi:hypothetical protein FA95DRAFT_749581 [Auriscalpium vulgare]|uniref:Uncharacterized protein n=1 Tax=Auriscalpium vulgare TaxID=40419 RepID=A0ACB8SCE0_9AGAM|nr:hypothetical protein FA95DRAFT_749581 [Auriscalpium vulgare]